jgi:hypothetical protein
MCASLPSCDPSLATAVSTVAQSSCRGCNAAEARQLSQEGSLGCAGGSTACTLDDACRALLPNKLAGSCKRMRSRMRHESHKIEAGGSQPH